MKAILGIDTSNYTTSLALIDCESGKLISRAQQLLPVKEGDRGIRQSDALFHHTKALPELFEQLFADFVGEIAAVCVSIKPSEQDGSYMPCFLAGISAASAVAQSINVPLYKTSHQTGHILACLYGTDNLQMIEKPFVCFHVSGGTTDALLVKPDEVNLLKVELAAKSLDLKAGQAVDRLGVKMGLRFPAGKELDDLSRESTRHFKQKGKLIGNDCSLSGLENLCLKMLSDGESQPDTARFCFDYIANTLKSMCEKILENNPGLDVFFAGGVMSNSRIKERLSEELGARFCPPEFSRDNAVGTAVYGYLKWNSLKN